MSSECSDHSVERFSLPEVLIAALILMIVLAAVVESQLNSFQTIDKTRQRNAVQARIAKDLNALKVSLIVGNASREHHALGWRLTRTTPCVLI